MTTPTQKLNAEIAALASNGITTASEYAGFLNQEAGESLFRLTEDADFWAAQGIHTARELAVSLNMSAFSDCYKEENGFRPRGWDYDRAMKWMDSHFGSDD